MPNRVNWAGMSCTSSIDCDDMEKLPMKFDIRVFENIIVYTESLPIWNSFSFILFHDWHILET